jgi:hypothetical protein
MLQPIPSGYSEEIHLLPVSRQHRPSQPPLRFPRKLPYRHISVRFHDSPALFRMALRNRSALRRGRPFQLQPGSFPVFRQPRIPLPCDVINAHRMHRPVPPPSEKGIHPIGFRPLRLQIQLILGPYHRSKSFIREMPDVLPPGLPFSHRLQHITLSRVVRRSRSSQIRPQVSPGISPDSIHDDQVLSFLPRGRFS